MCGVVYCCLRASNRPEAKQITLGCVRPVDKDFNSGLTSIQMSILSKNLILFRSKRFPPLQGPFRRQVTLPVSDQSVLDTSWVLLSRVPTAPGKTGPDLENLEKQWVFGKNLEKYCKTWKKKI